MDYIQTYNYIKYAIMAISIVFIIGIFLKMKTKKVKYVLVAFLGLVMIFALNSKFQRYATDDIKRQVFPIQKYDYNDKTESVNITYLDENNKEIKLKLNKGEYYKDNVVNGLGEVEKNKREYKKEIVFFNKFIMPIGTNFLPDNDIVNLSKFNFMTENEINDYLKQTMNMSNK